MPRLLSALLIPVASLLMAAGNAGAAIERASPNAALHGMWRNPDSTVSVRISDCGMRVCGVVVNATAEAVADSRDSGYPQLIGMELMRNYRADGPSHWSGTVFVPDLGRSFSSHIELIDHDHARISGCLWHGMFCKSQTWQRL